ncbi:MAG TPA: universal stress protein [Burkholderiales bacterium]|nr:universal stress protein [Burkholderiales bacterium]
MFKKILVCTDGSRLASKGVKAGVRLAAALGARVVGVYVIPPYTPPVYGDAAIYVPGLDPKDYRKYSERQARKALAAVEIEAQAGGVACETLYVTSAQPWEGILKTARARKCDALAMASHGRGGLGGLILGSETTRVLAHSKIPVLVCR